MKNEQDSYIKGHGTESKKCHSAHAEGFESIVYITSTESFGQIRILNLRKDGTRCELSASEFELRAAYKAMTLFLESLDSWKKEIKP